MFIMAQLCGILLILVLLWFYISHKRLDLYITRVYLYMLGINLVNLLLDVSSVVLLKHQDSISQWIVAGVCKLYLMSILAFTSAGLAYTFVDLYVKSKQHFEKLRITVAHFILGSILIACLPIELVKTQTGAVFTIGPAVIATYIMAVMCILWNLFFVIR